MLQKINLSTVPRGVHELTGMVNEIVEKSDVREGTCVLYTPHTTASLTITSYHDPAGFEDIQDEICRLIPTRVDFRHQFDTPSDAAGHVKSAIVGVGLPFIIHEGRLLLGSSQGIFFLEFDGPRQREVYVKIQSDEKWGDKE